jgi:hypothetical protein
VRRAGRREVFFCILTQRKRRKKKVRDERVGISRKNLFPRFFVVLHFPLFFARKDEEDERKRRSKTARKKKRRGRRLFFSFVERRRRISCVFFKSWR